MNKKIKPKKETDEQVEKMIKDWDIVNCYYCGKKISILEAKMTMDGSHFVCKKDCRG